MLSGRPSRARTCAVTRSGITFGFFTSIRPGARSTKAPSTEYFVLATKPEPSNQSALRHATVSADGASGKSSSSENRRPAFMGADFEANFCVLALR